MTSNLLWVNYQQYDEYDYIMMKHDSLEHRNIVQNAPFIFTMDHSMFRGDVPSKKKNSTVTQPRYQTNPECNDTTVG